MRTKITGLLSPKGEFVGSLILLVFAPLVPLVIDLFAKGTVQASTLFLTAALFTVSQAFGVRNFAVFLAGCVCVCLLLASYGVVLGAEVDAAAQIVAKSSEILPAVRNDVGNKFTDGMYYLSFAIITFFGIVQGSFRYRLHVLEEECFFEFEQASTQGK